MQISSLLEDHDAWAQTEERTLPTDPKWKECEKKALSIAKHAGVSEIQSVEEAIWSFYGESSIIYKHKKILFSVEKSLVEKGWPKNARSDVELVQDKGILLEGSKKNRVWRIVSKTHVAIQRL